MKIYIIILLSLLVNISSFNAIQLKERKEGKTQIISAKNNSDKDYEVTLSANCPQYNFSKSMPVTQRISAYDEVEMVRLDPKPNASTACKFSFNYTPVKQKSNYTQSISSQNIQMFVVHECPRCKTAKELMIKNSLYYRERNVTLDKNEELLMWELLKKHGYHDTYVTTPVIYYKNKLYYNINNLETFIANLK